MTDQIAECRIIEEVRKQYYFLPKHLFRYNSRQVIAGFAVLLSDFKRLHSLRSMIEILLYI
jgi:hypothetical protein